ncbi:putativeLINOLEOYL-CoA DESATURASE (DELTA(6)-DESATURASE) [Patulibacter medicamentivorans]|uniref:PutativeLINOLEOYL-CoA DESATURASE (DELTA(6)-DESATURASE) n=1 Tax=Patulibacter medicamentivorans TaxID=1097667 RepID=H0E3B7_9ACTN|nr:acyl-CoA desaturase [Patulibacter medicamentivorans]EHN11826.1 putativeLINOLEOYL-CoA DESATURASE (DELTA(6)-DESATURASE) [Patulibacter medicamentivorans]
MNPVTTPNETTETPAEATFVPALDPSTPLSPSAPDREASAAARRAARTDAGERRRIDPSRRVADAPLSAVPHLSQDDLDAFGREMERIRAKHVADLGERDATYIRKVIKAQRRLEIGGRIALELGFIPPFWLAGVAALSASKILDNMEIGHNVMHGQYDWMQDEELNGRTFEWDTACPADQWRHSHNYMHHTHTNIVGKDRDVGYGILRMSDDQPWEPYFLGNPVYASLLALLFEYGVALHDLEVEDARYGRWDWKARLPMMQAIWHKVRRQAGKDYLLFPALAGPFFPVVLAGNATANVVRNLWTFSIIFCGHFPDGVEEFTVEETAEETRGGWYVRQLLGSSNLTGGKLFHVMSGNLSFQIEHHLFPDIPAHRYAEISDEVREVCERYGLQYNGGPLPYQLFTVARKIVRLAWPTGAEADAFVASETGGRLAKTVVRTLRGATRAVRAAV